MPSSLTRISSRRLAALMLAQGWNPIPMRVAVEAVWPEAAYAGLVEQALAQWHLPYAPDEKALAEILWEYAPPMERHLDLPQITVPPRVEPLPPFQNLGLPLLASPSDLADWLGLPVNDLRWFADCDGRLARMPEPRSSHYLQHWLAKRRCGRRLVEAPLPRLKAIQRQILREILDLVPTHDAAFGFVKGRNCQQGAARHAGEEVVICCDLADFFPSVPASRVHAIFRCLGYTPSVARLLTGLVTVHTPHNCLAALPAADRSYWRAPHLPQGAPTSPALANLSAWRLDVRLSALAQRLGAQYSRYADDLTLSGDRALAFAKGVPLTDTIGKIAKDCGFRLNPTKTRIMRKGQRQSVTGLVVNDHLNVARPDFDRLKAILTNCLRHGPHTQNRDGHLDFQAHLNGRITWIETVNLRRGAKLRAIFDRIDWR